MSLCRTILVCHRRLSARGGLLCLLVAALLAGSFSSSEAQWSNIKTFPQQVRSVYFLDQVGATSTGFAGLTTGLIYRTTDNGLTWSVTNSPTSPNYEVSQFTFKNTFQGWCSLQSVGGGNGALLATTDGGLNWTKDTSMTGNVVSVGYSPATGELIAVNWAGSSARQSNNSGRTWTNILNAQTNQNGVTFGGTGYDGAMSTLSAPGFLYTTDGGLNWQPPNPALDYECWSPFAIPGDQHIFAVGEKTNRVFASVNGGASWVNTYIFQNSYIPTGCIMGALNSLFIQTSAYGFFCSTDQGNSWFSICGPSNVRDTRFYAKPSDKEIFSGDVFGNLWYNPDGTNTGAATLSLDKGAIAFSASPCGSSDSILHIVTTFSCTSGLLTKAQILTGSAAFSIKPVTLPLLLQDEDSIVVIYSPSALPKDTGSLFLEFTLGTTVIDTVIKLSGLSSGTATFNHVASISMTMPYACLSEDSTLVIHNLSCDSLRIIAESLTDSSLFKLATFRLPHSIAPFDSAIIPFYVYARHDGNFTSTLKLVMVGGTTDTIDDQIPLSINVFQGGEAEFGTLNVSTLDPCNALDTIFPILNTPCDSIVLINAKLSDTTYFHLGALVLPNTIRSAGELDLPMYVSPPPKGTYTSLLQLSYLSGKELVDTTITLSYQVLHDIPHELSLSAPILSMGLVGAPCITSEQYLYFTNTLCVPDTINGISWDSSENEYSFTPIVLPVALTANGGMDSVLVHFNPDSESAFSDKLRISLELNGVPFDTVLTVTGTGISTYHDSLLTQSLNFDSLPICQSAELEGEIVNLSCNNVIATSAMIAGDNGYNIISPIFPQTLQPGDTLHVLFALDPKQSGDAADSAIVTIHNPTNDSDYSHTILLNAVITPAVHSLSVVPNGFINVVTQPCSTVDTSIIIQNLGTCDDVVISSAKIVGDGAVIFDPPLTLPVVLPPDSSIVVRVSISPIDDSIIFSSIELTGMNIYANIPIDNSALAGGNSLSFSAQDSIFYTRPCVPETKTFSIVNSGCDSLTLDSVSLAGIPNETEFGLQGIPIFPIILPPNDTLRFAVQFDPNGNGDGLSDLEINSHQAGYSRAVPLAGNVMGTVPSARVALEASDLSQLTSCNAGDTIQVAAMLLDDIGDSTNLSTVSFALNANWDLLGFVKAITPAGWSISDTTMKPGGPLEVRLRHDAAGPVSGSTTLAAIYLTTYVTDSAACDITMDSLRFNDSEPDYEGCILASISLPDPVRFTEMDVCGSPVLRSELNGQLAFQIISVNPNPVPLTGGSAAATDIIFDLADEASVTFVVRDLLGRELSRTSEMFTSGSHTIRLSLPSNAEGNYFVEGESGGVRQTRNVVIEGK